MLPKVSLESFEEVTRQSRFDRRQFVQRVVDRICEENEILGLLLEQRSGEGIDLFGFCVAYESMRVQSLADLRAQRSSVSDRAEYLVAAIEGEMLGASTSLMAKAVMERARPEITAALAKGLLGALPDLPAEAPPPSVPILILPRSSGV